MNEMSKCAEINCSSFDNLYFSLEDVNIEIWVLKATVQKLLLSGKLPQTTFPTCFICCRPFSLASEMSAIILFQKPILPQQKA